MSKARREEYIASVNCYYTTPVKGCIKLADSVIRSGGNGNIISQDILDGAQDWVNNCANDVKQLRKMANMVKFASHYHELHEMASSLESLYKATDLRALYNTAYNVSQSSKNSSNYENIYNNRTIGSSGALAVVGMAAGKLRGTRVSEYDVYAANQYRTDIYWYVTESALRLDDQVTKFGSEVGTADKINRLISLSSNAKSGIVIQVNRTDYDQLRYLLAVGGSNGDLLVLDPISGSSSSISLKQLCANYGLDYGVTVSRIRSVWSYNLY